MLDHFCHHLFPGKRVQKPWVNQRKTDFYMEVKVNAGKRTSHYEDVLWWTWTVQVGNWAKKRLKFKRICLQQTFLRDSSERDGGKSEGDNKRFKEFGNNHFKVGLVENFTATLKNNLYFISSRPRSNNSLALPFIVCSFAYCQVGVCARFKVGTFGV